MSQAKKSLCKKGPTSTSVLGLLFSEWLGTARPILFPQCLREGRQGHGFKGVI